MLSSSQAGLVALPYVPAAPCTYCHHRTFILLLLGGSNLSAKLPCQFLAQNLTDIRCFLTVEIVPKSMEKLCIRESEPTVSLK